MEISLSNHEDRIKKLENNTSSGFTLKQLFSGSNSSEVTLNDNINNFDAIYILSNQNIGTIHEDINIIFKPEYNTTRHGNHVSSVAAFSYVASNNTIRITYNWGNTTSIIKVYGLKLYYNFSYNIYRLASSISFHFFKCLIKIRN